MPYYDYECTVCGQHFEEMQSFDERDRGESHERHEPLHCPGCGSPQVKQLLAASVHVVTAKKS